MELSSCMNHQSAGNLYLPLAHNKVCAVVFWLLTVDQKVLKKCYIHSETVGNRISTGKPKL